MHGAQAKPLGGGGAKALSQADNPGLWAKEPFRDTIVIAGVAKVISRF